MNAYLGVAQSATGRRWIGPDASEDRLSEAMAQTTGLPAPVCRVLVRRGVTPEDAADYLDPKLRALLPDPRTLLDLQRAAERIVTAISLRQKISIFADYDVDGGASAALLIDYLQELECTAELYVPDRIDEGYGPNVEAMQRLARDHDLIICVDCGTLSHEPIGATHGQAEVIVIDHHLGGETLPPAFAVVNPNRQDERGDLGHLCAAAVVFLVLVEINRQRREAALPCPDLIQLLDLVALATVADVAPLIGVNRAFVRQGLRVMSGRQRPGLVALSDVARLDSAPTAYHLGYVLGPRVNAGGRIGKADLGARLLASRNLHEATAMAERLDQLNKERRDIETAVREQALQQASERDLGGPLVWAAGDGWHPGVVGIVAARLKEATNRPAIVIGFDGEHGKGSGRSVSGVDLGAAIQKAAMEGVIEKGGGHKMAAGISLSRAQLDPAMERIGALLAKQGAAERGPSDLRIDGLLMVGAVSVELVEAVEKAGPYGAGSPAPRVAFADQAIKFARRVGENHLKISFGDTQGPRLDAIMFGAFDGPIGALIENHGGKRFHLAGRLDVNVWNGRKTPQLRLEDASLAE